VEDYTIARSALAVPSRVCAAVSIGGELPSTLVLIHRSAWKGNSANFALWGSPKFE
jgi:hypothetical protein